MSFRTNLVRARGHIVFLVALVIGLLLVLWLETLGDPPDPNAQSEGPDLMQTFDEIEPLPLAVRRQAQSGRLCRVQAEHRQM